MSNTLSPIGSVVKILNVRKTVMIYGRNQLQTSSQKKYDYVSVPYPEGNINENYNLFFNHDMIEEVLFEGYQTQEEKAFQETFKG
nr:DUF4176 domain-containing protein [Bacillus subtilis]